MKMGVRRHFPSAFDVITAGALFAVNADDAATFWTFVFGFLLRDECVDPVVLYELQVFDHTHAIFCSVSFIQMIQSITRRVLTLKTESCPFLLENFAVFDFTSNNGNFFIGICCPATWAFIFFSQISHANAAVHAAGCDQLCIEFSIHGSSNRIISII